MPDFEKKSLILDSRFEPIKVLSLEKSFVLVYSGKCNVLVESHVQLRSVNHTWTAPWVVQLFGCSPKSVSQAVRFSRQGVYLRDQYTCQYCNFQGHASHLTLDHIIPQAKGGKTNWENIVTACKLCNSRKGAKKAEEIGMKLRKAPEKPQLISRNLFPFRYGITEENVPEPWLPFLDLSLVKNLSQKIAI